MSPRAWEEYLFNEHKALAVSPLRGTEGLQLFDVLVKRSNFRLCGGPVVCKIGSFFGCSLRKGEDEEDFQVVDKLKEALQKFKKRSKDQDFDDDSDHEEEAIIRREDQCSIKETFKASSKILASIMELGSLQDKSSKVLTCKLQDVTLNYVDREALREAIDVWKPNMEFIAKHTNSSMLSGHLDLWLITDILYADKVTIEDSTSKSSSAGFQVGSMLGTGVGAPPSMGAKLETERSKGIRKELTGGNIPFAIRTLLLRYNSMGMLVHIDTDGGKRQPIVRGSTDRKFLDPVRDPTYNMGDLFLYVPNNPEEEYIPIEVVLEDAAESAQLSEVSDVNSDN